MIKGQKRNEKDNIITIICVIFCLIAVFSVSLVVWVFNNWGGLTADVFIYTMTSSLEGTNPTTIRNAILFIVPIVTVITVGLYLFLRTIKKDYTKVCFILIAGFIGVIVITCAYFFGEIGMLDYLKKQNTYSTFIEDNYTAPNDVVLEFPEKKKNLIYIYIESMESTFSDKKHGGAEEEDIIPELTKLSIENESFSGNEEVVNGGYALQGTTYTMGGLFAQTSGLPLKVTDEELSASEGYLSSINCLGDILFDNGYDNYFCIGTVAAFGGREKYFKDHGNYTIFDYNYSVRNGEISNDYSRDWWGYDDYILYENAKKHLLEISSNDTPFNFTMLTVDSHAENGYICDKCPSKFDDDYSNVFACASTQVYDFISWIKKQDFYENTTIIINGDHCTMDSDFCDNISEDYARKTYTVCINSPIAPLKEDYRLYSTFDLFPTTLASLGVMIEGDRLGLGVNLFSEEKSLVELDEVSYLNSELSKKSKMIEDAIGVLAKKAIKITYNNETNNIEISFDKDDNEISDYTRMYSRITNKKSDVSNNYVMEDKDTFYYIEIPLSDFLYEEGDYLVQIYTILQDGYELTYLNAAESINIDGINVKSDIDYSVDDENIYINYYMEEKVSMVSFAVWSPENGQDDLCWYEGNYSENTWEVVIPKEKHATSECLSVHVYKNENDENEFLTSFLVKP